MSLDEAIVYWVLQWGEPNFYTEHHCTQEAYEFLVWLGEELGYGREADYPTASYTWMKFRIRFQEMKNELASNRQPKT